MLVMGAGDLMWVMLGKGAASATGLDGVGEGLRREGRASGQFAVVFRGLPGAWPAVGGGAGLAINAGDEHEDRCKRDGGKARTDAMHGCLSGS